MRYESSARQFSGCSDCLHKSIEVFKRLFALHCVFYRANLKNTSRQTQHLLRFFTRKMVSYALGTLFDGIARHTQEGHDFVARAKEAGFRQAVRGRDDPFGDYGSGPKSKRGKSGTGEEEKKKI